MVAQSPDAARSVEGLRILLVEDNYLVATALQRLLAGWGCEVVGPAPSVERGRRLAMEEQVSGAILDVNIQGGSSAPIAEALEEQGLPYFFITGYASPHILPTELLNRRRLNKPLSKDALFSAIVEEFVGT